MRPDISVIMAVHNSEETLAESIRSILDQTYDNIEFFIILDGCTDHSIDIVERFRVKDLRIQPVVLTSCHGLAYALNVALGHARGTYIARQDADDISFSNRLERQMDFMERHPDVFLLGSAAILLDKETGETRRLYKRSHYIRKSFTSPRRIFQTSIFHPTIFFRNEGYLYREKFFLSQDYDFYLRLLSDNKRLYTLADPLIQYRYQPSETTAEKQYRQRLFAQAARDIYFQPPPC